jgi:endo-1,4-beta-xylanase
LALLQFNRTTISLIVIPPGANPLFETQDPNHSSKGEKAMKHARILTVIAILALALALLPNQTQEANAESQFLGNIWGSGTEPLNFGQYWNQVTPENSGKWASVEPSRDQMSWNWLDSAYNYAKSNGMPFKEHTFVWGHSSGQPDWVCSLSESEQRAEVEGFMQSVCSRYSNIDYIDVVNEPLHDQPCYKNALGGDGSTGWDWVIWSYEKARQYCGSSKLLLNDYGILNSSSNTSQYITIINLLKSRGLIDGVGAQGHGLESTSNSTIQSNLNTLAGTGLPIFISEYDVDRADDNQQLQIYQQQFPIFWEHSAVQGVTLWGYIEGEIWKSNAYLIHSDGSERPAMTWLMQYVNGPIPTQIPPTNVPPTGVPPTGVPPTSIPPTTQPGACSVDYNVQNQWGGGATVNVIVNSGSSTPINGWTLTWTFPGNQQITNLWNGTYSQSGSSVSVSNASWNPTIPANGSVGFGFNMSFSGSNDVPTDFALNGVACNGGPSPTQVPPTSVPPTSVPPTSQPGTCSVDYVVQNQWGEGATIGVAIQNNGGTINGWTLTWTFPGNQQITSLWNGTYSQSGSSVSVSNASWNSTIPSNGSVSFGFNLFHSGSNGVPTDFALNGTLCQ